ncbi:MAG: ribosome biogenesis GTPase YlqF [Lachnospiraceae bacterium]|nr:ribosome biogenesis GTPase YlqF [Lachnospiraceae bacterium]
MPENINNINWYPGHMTKAKRLMTEELKLVDLIIELVDARAPLSTRNPDLINMASNKSRIILLNKADLSDKRFLNDWIKYFKNEGSFAIGLDSRTGKSMAEIRQLVNEACAEKIERYRKRGIKNRPIRAMVAGIPNVGKSTFINTLTKNKGAKTGNKPGVTRGKQWIRVDKDIDLLDTPGILWPKFSDEKIGIKLALIGSINDDILNMEDLAYELIKILFAKYPEVIKERYEVSESEDPYKALEEIAINRKCIKKGNTADIAKAADLLIDEFRSGKLGYITLDNIPGGIENE